MVVIIIIIIYHRNNNSFVIIIIIIIMILHRRRYNNPMTNVNISYSSVSNGETTLKNEDSINVRSYILFFSFRRFFFIFSLTLFRISSTFRSRIFHTRILTRLRFLLFTFFFLLLISPFLSHTRTLSPSVSCLIHN